MIIKPIRNSKQHEAALKRIDEIFEAKKGTPLGDELEILAILVEKYEEEHFPIPYPDPLEAIKFRMDQMGMTNQDLADIIGYKSRVSEFLNRKRKLPLEAIRRLHEHLNIPADILIKAY